MNKLIPLMILATLISSCASNRTDKKTIGTLPTEKVADFEKVAEFKGMQVTGVTAAQDGRIFANFPRWRKNLPFSVVEVNHDGGFTPYPNKEWNKGKGKGEPNKFTCVQSVIAHKNSLFVLDPSSPMMEAVVGNAKLYEFDLTTNKLKRTYTFDANVAPKKSYLNDLRIDDKARKIYITDSGIGGLVVLDMDSGEARRVLSEHKLTTSENVILTVDKNPFLMKGKAPKIHSDGIALSKDRSRLYWHALTGYTLYSVPTEVINNRDLKTEEIAEKVTNHGTTPAPDGMIFDDWGNLYMADLERNAVVYRKPSGEMKILVQDERIKWPDTFTIDPVGNLLFTDSLLQKAPAGTPVDQMTFTIYKVRLPQVSEQ